MYNRVSSQRAARNKHGAQQAARLFDRLVGKVALAPRPKIYGVGLCACGCGGQTSVLAYNDSTTGAKKGEHRKFVKGHRLSRSS